MGHPAVGAAGDRGDARPHRSGVARRSSPDVGTAAWIDCAGHLPVGTVRRPAARRRALADLGDRAAAGAGRRAPGAARARSGRPTPAASLSVKLCDVFPDGTSALVTRGTPRPRLPRRRPRAAVAAGARPGVRRRGRPRRLRLPVDARPDAAGLGRRRRLAEHDRAPGAGVDHAAHGVADAAAARRGRLRRARSSGPGAEHSSESTEGVGWSIHHDVLHRHDHGARRGPTAATPRRTTAPRTSSTSARSRSTRAPSPRARTPTRSST